MGLVVVVTGAITDSLDKELIIQIATIDKLLEINQGRVSGKCRKRIVRGVPVPGWAKRQNLPDALTCYGKEIDKVKGFFTHISDTERAR